MELIFSMGTLRSSWLKQKKKNCQLINKDWQLYYILYNSQRQEIEEEDECSWTRVEEEGRGRETEEKRREERERERERDGCKWKKENKKFNES